MTIASTIRRASMSALVLLLVAACGNDQGTPPAAAPATSSLATTAPPPSPTASPRPKLSPHDTCVQVDGPVQEAVRLAALFSTTVGTQTLDPAPFAAVAATLRAGYEVAAPELAPNLLIVTANAERMTKIINGSTVHFEAEAFREAAITITLDCAKLGVIPPVPSPSK